jgi:hypothetical protein
MASRGFFIEPDFIYSSLQGGTNITATTVTTTVTNTLPLSPSSAPTSGFTNFSIPELSSITSLYLNCPALTSTTYTARNSSNIFAITCNLDYSSTVDASNKDIATIITYSLEDCLEACSAITNHGFISCAGALFLSDIGARGLQGGNCVLKNSLVTSSPGNGNNGALGKLLHG